MCTNTRGACMLFKAAAAAAFSIAVTYHPCMWGCGLLDAAAPAAVVACEVL